MKIAKGFYVKWFEVWIWGQKLFDFCTSAFVIGIQKENALWWQKYPQNWMKYLPSKWKWIKHKKQDGLRSESEGKNLLISAQVHLSGIQKENALWWQKYPQNGMKYLPSKWIWIKHKKQDLRFLESPSNQGRKNLVPFGRITRWC